MNSYRKNKMQAVVCKYFGVSLDSITAPTFRDNEDGLLKLVSAGIRTSDLDVAQVLISTRNPIVHDRAPKMACRQRPIWGQAALFHYM